ncbi:MAG TPA: hypothetical protein PK406_14545 [Verrucomicrobiota bacterium]|nr:hypothetical protein [Verrucomicrobiota bacterium]
MTTVGEFSELAAPRACFVKGRLHNSTRNDYALVEIEPPLSGQGFGILGQDIICLLLSTKIKGETLFPIQQWPSPVYVARILDESILETLSFKANQVEVIAWGFVYPSFEEAANAASQF